MASSIARLPGVLLSIITVIFSTLLGASALAEDDPERLAARAGDHGRMPVIIQLDVPAQAVGRGSPSSYTRRVSEASDALLARMVGRMGGFDQGAIKSFKHVPYIAATLDADALRAAASDPSVVSIHEDVAYPPLLDESVALVGGTAAHAQGFRGQGQVVAVLDTGTDRSHPFLSGKVVDEACFSTTNAFNGAASVCPNGQGRQTGVGAAAPCSVSGCDHGTHVAGIAAGRGATSTGVAPDADIMALQVFSAVTGQVCGDLGLASPCALTFLSDQIAALEYVFEQRTRFAVAAVNMSLGGGRFATPCTGDPTRSAIDLLRNANIATVVASGNEGFVDAISAPACVPSAISVGSTTKGDEISNFSNGGQLLDLLAPGSAIESSVPGARFATFNGTSMSTPHVAGAFAVIRSKAPTASVEQILTALRDTGRLVVDPPTGISRPRINVDAALDLIAGSVTGAALTVAPAAGYNISGPQGGPFAPGSRSYTLSNVGSTALDFTVSENVTWINVAPASGRIAAGGSSTVTASVDVGVAAALPPGTNASSISFVNVTNGQGSSTRGLNLSVVAQSNDKFEGALRLNQTTGTTAGSNVATSKESGEPNHAGATGGQSVWWRWTAPASGEVTFDTFGSSFDTLLAAYTGDSVSALVPVAGNDDAGTGTQSEVRFLTEAGVSYAIAVDGFLGASGDITLNWSFVPGAVSLGDVAVDPQSGFSARGPRGGPFTPTVFTYTLTNVSTSTQSYQVRGVPSWLTATPLSGTLAPRDSATVELRISGNAAGLAPGTQNSAVMFNGVARSITLEVTSGPIANDNYAAAAEINPVGVTVFGNTVGAGKETNEPDHAGNAGGASAWWRFTAPASATLNVSTSGSAFDTLLGVYTGNQVGDLTAVAANDDSGSPQSRLSFPALAGTTYFIAVDGFNGASGAVTLTVGPSVARPPSDDFSNARVITGNSVIDFASNIEATKEAAEPDHAGNAGGRSVWWSWTAAKSANFSIDTFGSNFDTLLAVYLGSTVNALTEVASNDDTGSSRRSSVTFAARAGSTYRIAVDGFNGEEGDILLRLSDGQPVLQSAVLPTSRSVQVGGLASVFAVIINDGATAAIRCRITMNSPLPVDFTYQTTDPLTNLPTGFANTPVDIDVSGIQNFIVSMRPGAVILPTEAVLAYLCDNAETAASLVGINTVLLSASSIAVADVIALVATVDNNGIVNIPGASGIGAFALATVNVGAASPITVSVDTGAASLPITVSVCRTDPSTGSCLSQPRAQISTSFAADETATFSVFVTGNGTVPFDPATARVFVRFRDASGQVRGATSVAVRTF